MYVCFDFRSSPYRLDNTQQIKPPPKIIMKFSTAIAIIAARGLNAPTADAAISSNRHGHAAGLVALVSSAHLLKSAEAVS
jgi:hypothetical protein